MNTGQLVFGVLAFCLHFTAHALQHYRVDFSSPPHVVGQLPKVQIGPAGPSQVFTGFPTVMSSFGHLTNQPLVFKGVHYAFCGPDCSARNLRCRRTGASGLDCGTH